MLSEVGLVVKSHFFVGRLLVRDEWTNAEVLCMDGINPCRTVQTKSMLQIVLGSVTHHTP